MSFLVGAGPVGLEPWEEEYAQRLSPMLAKLSKNHRLIILFSIGFLCSLAISYWMTRVLGARRHLLYSIALYAAGALGCFLSPHSLKFLLISRTVMGFGGGAFLVRTVVLVRLMFPGKASAFALSWFYFELYVFAVIYPAAMGWISDSVRW